MVVLIQQSIYRNDEITSGGLMERVSLWRYICENFESPLRLIVAEQNRLPKYLPRVLGKVKSMIRILARIATSRHKIYIMIYPISFPFQGPQSAGSFATSLTFVIFLKIISVMKGGTVVIKAHDIPRFCHEPVMEGFPHYPARLTRFFEFILLRLADEVWATSRSIGNFFITDLGLSPRKFKTVINGSPRMQLVPLPTTGADHAVKFVYSGTLWKGKGVEQLIKAFLSMNTGRNTELILCGDRGEWIPESYEDDRLAYLGLLPAEDALGVVSACDVAIIPYPRGTFSSMMFPTKLAQYIACEMPVLTTDIEETARIVTENEIGMSTPLPEIAKAMEYLAENDALREKYKRNCRRIKENYYWDTILDEAFETVRDKYDLPGPTGRNKEAILVTASLNLSTGCRS